MRNATQRQLPTARLFEVLALCSTVIPIWFRWAMGVSAEGDHRAGRLKSASARIAVGVVLAGAVFGLTHEGRCDEGAPLQHEQQPEPRFRRNALYMGVGGKGVVPIFPAFFYERTVCRGFSWGVGTGRFSTDGPSFLSGTGYGGYRWPSAGEHAAVSEIGMKYVCITWDHYEHYGDLSEYPGCEDNFVVLGALGYEYRTTFFFRVLFVPQWVFHQETEDSHLIPSHPTFWGELDFGVAF